MQFLSSAGAAGGGTLANNATALAGAAGSNNQPSMEGINSALLQQGMQGPTIFQPSNSVGMMPQQGPSMTDLMGTLLQMRNPALGSLFQHLQAPQQPLASGLQPLSLSGSRGVS